MKILLRRGVAKGRRILASLIIAEILFCSSFESAKALTSSDTVRSSPKKTVLLLPDGRALPADKLDSLEQAWGKGRVSFGHNAADDANGIMHLIRVTDEMKAESDSLEAEKLRLQNALLNKPAPDFSLRDLQGRNLALRSLRGKIVVLNFWFTSCIPCI